MTDGQGPGNVVSLLGRAADRHPDRPALVVGGEATSYGDLWRRVLRVAAGLRSRGLAPGDRLLVAVPMSVELYVALLGVLAMGGVGLFVDPWVGRRRMASLAALAEPRGFVGSGRSHLLRLLEPGLRRLPVAVTVGRRVGPLPAGMTLAELEAEGAAAGGGEVVPRGPDDSALVTLTTGSSGAPKGVDRTHGFLVAQHRALARELPYRDKDVDMPLFPVFALNDLAWGITAVVPEVDFRRIDAVDPVAIARQIERWGVTTVTASPPFVDRLAEHLEARGSVPPLRRLLTGGAPVRDRQLRAWRRVLPETEIVVVYGSTEAEPVAHLSAEDRLALSAPSGTPPRGTCVGPLATGLEGRVASIVRGKLGLDESGDVPALPQGEVGELLVTGPHVSRGYFRSPAAQREAKLEDRSGRVWHRMGDTGYFDESGRFWLVGRVHSTLRRNGSWVHPHLVEQAARGDDDRVRRVAAVGLPPGADDQRVVVVVEGTGGDALRSAVEDRLRTQPVDAVLVTSTPLPVDPRHASKIEYDAVARWAERQLGE